MEATERMEAYTAEQLHDIAVRYLSKRGIGINHDAHDDCAQEFVLAGLAAATRDNGTGIRAYQYISGKGAALRFLTEQAYIDAAPLPSGDSEKDSNGDCWFDGCDSVVDDAPRGISAQRERNPLDALIQTEQSARLNEVISSLTDRERDLIEARIFRGEEMTTWASRNGMSYQWGCKLQNEILERMRSMMTARAN